jgi:hypothetical protein
MPFPIQCVLVLVLRQDVLVELEIRP